MASLTLMAVMHAVLLAGGQSTPATETTGNRESTYTEAHKVTSETGRPMLVLVSAKWCPACQTMKKSVMPQILRRGLLRRCVYTVVDLDEQKNLGHELTSGGPIPQLIMYRKTNDGWRRRKLIGGQSVNNVVKFIDQGIQLDKQEKETVDDEKESDDKDRQASMQSRSSTAPQS